MRKTGILFILFTANNVICTFTNLKGDSLIWVSAGSKKSKGLKKSIPTIIYTSITKITLEALNLGFTHIHLKFKGLNKNKKSIIKALRYTDIKLLSLQDVTALPHNGCRVARKRRL